MKIFSTSFYKFLLISVVSITISFFMLAPEARAATISRPMQSLGLVGYWSFDVGKGGAKAVDMSGRGNNGTLTNMSTTAAWVGGKIGNALNFDGSNDFVALSDSSALDFIAANSYSWSFWIKEDDFMEWNAIWSQRMESSNSEGIVIYGHTTSDTTWGPVTGGISFGVVNSSNQLSMHSTNSVLTLGVWHHVVVIYNGGLDQANRSTIYVDTRDVTDRADVYSSGTLGNLTTNTQHRIGNTACSVCSGEFFKGSLDDVRVYNRALSAAEIKRLYRQTSPQMNASQANKLRQGLVGMWTFDGNDMSGNTAIDRSGQGNNGTLTNGVKKTIGKIGQGLSFGGDTPAQSVQVNPVSSSLNITGNITISAWIKPNTLPASAIATKSDASGGTFDYLFYISYYTSKLAWQVGVSSQDSSQTLSSNVWQHVVGVYNGSQVIFYVNGVSDSHNYTTNPTNSVTIFSIGSIANRANYHFNGLIDDVRIYNRALTPAEIRQLYKAGSSFHPNVTNKSSLRDGLVGHWTFDGADMGTTSARDASGNANTGWLINGTKKTIGRIGQALNFDGSNDYVGVTDQSNLRLTSSITLSAWVRPRALPGSYAHFTIIEKGLDGDTIQNYGLYLGYDNLNYPTRVNFAYDVDYSGTHNYISTGNVFSVGTWTHITFTYTFGTAQTAQFYVNGQSIAGSWASGGGAVTPPVTNAQRLFIGINNRLGTLGSAMNGLIDDVRIYNRALTPAEIKRLYNMGR